MAARPCRAGGAGSGVRYPKNGSSKPDCAIMPGAGRTQLAGTCPWMVCHLGRYWTFDGHHRVMCAIDRGERYIRAHVKHPQFNRDHSTAGRTR